MITALYLGTDRLDLFEDEDIVIKNKVSDIEDIKKVFTDTSNSFSVPASDVNNRIFKHYYNANVVNGFDARKKIDGTIELNGINYKVGKFRLNKVVMKSNRPSSYSLDFFGNLVTLKDLLTDDKLSDLDFSALDFAHDSINVGSRLVNQGDIIMSLFGNRRYLYDSSNATPVNDTQTNIYYNGADANSGVKFSEPKASIKNLTIIEAIETKYNLVFSRDFFGGNEFSNLYMLLSGKIKNIFKEEVPIVSTNDPTTVGNVILANEETGTYYINYSLNIGSGFEGVDFKLIVKSDGVVIYDKGFNGDVKDNLFVSNFNSFKKITFEIEANEPLEYDMTIKRYTDPITFFTSNSPFRIIESDYIVSDNIPDLKVIDYLSGLFKLYKLVAIVQKDGSVYVDSLVNYYRKGKVYNIDKFVDYRNITISKGKILNEIKYTFKEPTSLLNTEFAKRNNDIAYGDLELSIYDANGQLVDGSELKYDVPFEQIVYERIIDLNATDEVNLQYALLADENIEATQPKAHLHYNYYTVMDSPIKIISDSNVGTPFYALNMPMHTLGVDAPVFSTVFGEEFNEYNGNLITETIYKTHHQNYIEGVFSEKRRVYSITVKDLPYNVIQSINLNDVLEIKDDYYRIDNMNVNIKTREVKFKLINAINLDLTPLFSVSLDREDITLDNVTITLDNI